jgi:hypothetical protein
MNAEKPIVVVPLVLKGAPDALDRDYAHGEVMRHYLGKPYLDLSIHLEDIVDADTAEDIRETHGAVNRSNLVYAKLSIYPGGGRSVELISDTEYTKLGKKVYKGLHLQSKEYEEALRNE